MINRPRCALLLLAVLLTPVATSAQQAAPQRADSAAIVALIEEVEAANNAGDVERWVGLFASDFVYMAPGAAAVTSRAELRQVAETGFRNQAAVDIEPVEIQVHGSWAFARNRVTGTVKLHGSERVVNVDVKQLVIYSRDAQGRWRIARFSSNSNS